MKTWAEKVKEVMKNDSHLCMVDISQLAESVNVSSSFLFGKIKEIDEKFSSYIFKSRNWAVVFFEGEMVASFDYSRKHNKFRFVNQKSYNKVRDFIHSIETCPEFFDVNSEQFIWAD